ncbi:hypothetical protein XM38_023790 [Halomicronema hongdechloris C2206]|uniref:Uncharacterized protein n=1 Tax=Halomicronema hongdechloris C2206 TaxID=1641165 RepID=A0A1Z3HMQ5_9CYAN|nr:hypothetical protein [Halomicronema hongdechloris]ASC71427.1 hypothetical protein XM38_023790 [Halomicronema hongdechloris C2206]
MTSKQVTPETSLSPTSLAEMYGFQRHQVALYCPILPLVDVPTAVKTRRHLQHRR